MSADMGAMEETEPVEAGWLAGLKERALAVKWRIVAAILFGAAFLVLATFSIAPLLVTALALWIVTGVVGLIFAFLSWPKTLWRSIVKVYTTIRDAIAAVCKAIWLAVKAVGKAIRVSAVAIWRFIVATIRAIRKTIVAIWRAIIAWFRRRTLMDIVFTALWGAVGIAVANLYVLDARFYGEIAPPSINVWIYRAFGVVFRTFVVGGGLAIVWLKQTRSPRPWFYFTRLSDKGWARWVPVPHIQLPDTLGAAGVAIRVIWSMGLVASVVSAMGSVAEGNDYHARKAGATVTAERITTESQSDKIARLNADKADIRKDRDAAVAQANHSIELIENDGVPGISAADNISIQKFQAAITKAQEDADGALKDKGIEITAAENKTEDAHSTANVQGIENPELAAVWQLPTRYILNLNGIWLRDGFAVFWILLLENIGSFGAMALYALHLFIARRKGLQAAGSLGGKTTARRQRVDKKLKAIEHLNKEPVAPPETVLDEDTGLEPEPEGEIEPDPELEPDPEADNDDPADLDEEADEDADSDPANKAA